MNNSVRALALCLKKTRSTQLACVTLLLMNAIASAVSFDFTTVLNGSDLATPAGTLPLFDFSVRTPNGFVTEAQDFNNNFAPLGIYEVTTGQSPIQVVAPDAVDPISGVAFTSFLGHQSNGSVTSFFGVRELPDFSIVRGIYLNNGAGGSIEAVAVTGQPLPSGGGTISSVGFPQISTTDVAFALRSDDLGPTEYRAIMTRPLTGGSFTTLVDTNTAVPGQPGFVFDFGLGLAENGYDDNRAIFIGEYEDMNSFTQGGGVYSVTAGSAPEVVLAQGTSIDGFGQRYNLSGVSTHGDDVYVNVSRFAVHGIYSITDDQIENIVHTSTALPHASNETFEGPFRFSTSSDGRVAFEARGSDGSSGIYLYDDGEIVPVLTTLDTLDGYPVGLAGLLSANSFQDDQLLLDVVLVDNANMVPIGTVMLAEILPDSPPGDYNGDFVVDAADFTVWRDNLNLSVNLPGDMTPGSVSQEDYDVWKSNFGANANPPVVQSVVPEPSGGWLWMLAMCAGVQAGWHASSTCGRGHAKEGGLAPGWWNLVIGNEPNLPGDRGRDRRCRRPPAQIRT